MSRIYFHTKDASAEIWGPERHHMGGVIGDILLMSVGNLTEHKGDRHWLRSLTSGYLSTIESERFERAAETWIRIQHDHIELPSGKTDLFTIGLNTAMDIGNDCLRLFARLHGQCELHCYVRPSNRKWLAGIIAEGRRSGLYRAGMGWEGLIDFLSRSDDSPVVCSYSVCERFPNAGVANWDNEVEDSWYDTIDSDERWRLAWNELSKDGMLELKPENFADYRFGDGLNGFKLPELAASLVAPVVR